MKIKTTAEITIGNIFGDTATYNGDNWIGSKELVSMVSNRKTSEITGYQYDPILNYAEYICSVYPELSIISSKTIEEEYPDDTVF